MTPASRDSVPDAIPHVDLSKLTQSELLALSLCSCSAFDTRRTEDLVLPQVDRSLFNESAGSRRQTYSRLRRYHHRNHRPTRFPSNPISSADPSNRAVVHYLKYFLRNPDSDSPPPPPPPPPSSRPTQPLALQQISGLLAQTGNGKRKQGTKDDFYVKPRVQASGVDNELELKNKNNVVVDFTTMENNGDGVFGEELRRRTIGLESEGDALGFLSSLEGQWCSRRMKRKYVDANDFGDTLPVGWKLLIALRRREGRVSVYCRRYVSPTGQQFLSCKEVAAFLRSHFMSIDANQVTDHRPSPIMQLTGSNSENNVGSLPGDDTGNHDLDVHSVTETQGNELFLEGIDILPDVLLKDLFECYKCNVRFHEKDAYLEHLLSFHQHTTKRIRTTPSVGEGIIIKDRKYECEFCHKVFEERSAYNGHVRIHVRNNVKGFEGLYSEKSVDAPQPHIGLPIKTSRMEALIDIGQNSISETRAPDTSNTHLLSGIVNSNEVMAASTDREIEPRTDPTEVDLVDTNTERTLDHGANQCDEETVKSCETQTTEVNLTESSKYNCEHPEVENMQIYDPQEHDAGLRENTHNEPNNPVVVPETTQMTLKENVFDEGVTDSTMAISQTLDDFDTFTVGANKEQDGFCVLKIENEISFEELTLDDIEPFKFDFSEGHDGCGMEVAFNNSSLGFGSGEAAVLSMGKTHQLTTVCVWCRSEFILEAFESETQSDSIGYMCPECKAKISGHLENGLSLSSHGF
ncbi:unnamed protein product [Cuscuta campestris]|uniref:C2H2-type domain-containing protein n=1 Tax=Cuscuta campestris TaxID=132261 RepID=A0A484LPU5_9ASTE|nr:unnamed protein product [Cuscuta campestris]